MGADKQETVPALDQLIGEIHFDAAGLVPAIAQDETTGEILMVAWMNEAAIRETLASGRVCYWSRSRGRLWRKGERSGQTQELRDFLLDCDGDTVLLKVAQTGVACHTGRRSCFFRAWRRGRLETIAEVVVDPDELYGNEG